ncbi:hypothetical protein PG984_005406 [Apiospora sp. TS-2023a]
MDKLQNLDSFMKESKRLICVVTAYPAAAGHLEDQAFRPSTAIIDDRIERGDHPGQPDTWSSCSAVVFITAGTEKSATLLSGLCYYLMANPDKMQLLPSEIRGTFVGTTI